VEGATFGSEFMAMTTVAEVNKCVRYKLRMMGIPIDGTSFVYGDNMSVLHNMSNPESTPKKKSNSVAYHLVRESIAMDEMRAGYINTDENYGDLITKALSRGERRENLLRGVTWDIYSKARYVLLGCWLKSQRRFNRFQNPERGFKYPPTCSCVKSGRVNL
jgi:hypothetical protein